MVDHTALVRAAMRRRYAAPEWALLEEVRNGTGHQRKTTRYADGFAMNLYPSRGMEIHGIEIKVDRRDWQRERKAPDKAESIAAFCDRWWLAIHDERVAPLSEVPPTWGVYLLKGEKFTELREAKPLKARQLDRLMIASLLRNATDTVKKVCSTYVSPEKVEEAVANRLGWEKQAWERDAHAELLRLRSAHQRLCDSVRTFEQQTGLNVMTGFLHPSGVRIREAIEALDARDRFARQLGHDIEAMQRTLQALEQARKAMAKSVSDGDAAA